jgi:two-component system, sensor histidine kinase LadS
LHRERRLQDVLPKLLHMLKFISGLLLSTLLGLASALPPATAQAQPVMLYDATPSILMESPQQVWLEPGSHATIEVASSTPQNFVSLPALTRHNLATGTTLWIKFSVARGPFNTAQWTLNVPIPYLDSVTLYQRNAEGTWTAQTAGDVIAQNGWSRKGLYPDFEVTLPDSGPQELVLQVRNFKASAVPVRLVSRDARESRRLTEWLVMGVGLGALIAMAALSALRFGQHGSQLDGWAALYALLISIALAQVNGVLNALVWADQPEIGDYAVSLLSPIAVGCTLLFVRQLYTLSTRYRRYDRFLAWAAWITIASVASYLVLDRKVADLLGSITLIFATMVGLVATVLSWRGGSSIGRWMLLAYLPQFLGAMYLFAEAMGLVPTLWEMRYITSLSIAMSVPVLVYVLSQITHDRKELVVRARHLPTQDALTGLLTAEVFQNHLEGALMRSINAREPIALVMVSVVNHDYIRSSFGDTTAEQCILRAVIKIQRILRDVDPAGRVDTANFALLMEGMRDRKAVTERMVNLIASGLIPLPGLTPEVVLHFQAACVLLHENPVPADRVLDDLRAMLAEMSSRSRRPVRFLEPIPTEASPLQSELGPN